MAFAKATVLAHGQVPSAAADLYLVDASQSAYIKSLRFFNTAVTQVTLTLWIRVGGVNRRILYCVLEAGESMLGSDLVLGDSQSIRGVASIAAAIDYVLEGVIES